MKSAWCCLHVFVYVAHIFDKWYFRPSAQERRDTDKSDTNTKGETDHERLYPTLFDDDSQERLCSS